MGAAAIPHGDAIRYVITSSCQQPTTVGEIDGRDTARLRDITEYLKSGGFSVATCSNMDAWLKTHAAEIVPMANALYRVGGDPARLARDHDALILTVRAIREGYRVLQSRGVPVTPSSHSLFRWLPEPLLGAIMKRLLASKAAQVQVGHAKAARGEMSRLTSDLAALARHAGISTPGSLQLARCEVPLAAPPASAVMERRATVGPHVARRAG